MKKSPAGILGRVRLKLILYPLKVRFFDMSEVITNKNTTKAILYPSGMNNLASLT